MPDIEELDPERVTAALARAGEDPALRGEILESLRMAQLRAADPKGFREQVRWPLVAALLRDARVHQVRLRNGVAFEVSLESRIERALLLSADPQPDHIWEPQTTRLLCLLSEGAGAVIVGGAYIGDQVLMIAATLAKNGDGIVHAFEPMTRPHAQLLRNIELNGLGNVRPHRLGLWADSNAYLSVDGDAALASSHVVESQIGAETVRSISIDDYVAAEGLRSVELIMLDTEGGEEEALRGASKLLDRPDAPNIVFEIHRSFVDWTDGLPGTAVVRMLTDRGYDVFAIRDFHDNYDMTGRPIEIVPAASVYLEGPPHGFNMLATRDRNLVARLGLRIVENVSPKLLLEKDPRLHHPLA
jgi:FkbM family methyltransferase